MRGFKALMTLAVTACLSAPLVADEVFFKNGDHLTGKITALDGEKLVINSVVAGTVSVNLKDIKTFSTEKPLLVQLSDGTVVNQRIIAGPDGQFTAAPGGALVQQNFKVSQIARINPVKWTGNVVIGGFLARGNTDVDSFSASSHAVRKGDDDRLTLDAGYLYAREKPPGTVDAVKKRTEDNWFFEGKYDYFYSKKLYAYADVRVERDLIANLSLRLTPGAGVGYQWFDNPNDFRFNTEGGVSWLYRDYSNDGTDESVALRLAYHLTKKFNDHIVAFHDLEYFPGLDSPVSDFLLITDAGIHTAITDHLFTEFKIELRHDNQPAPKTQKDDVRYTMGIGWSF